MDAFGIAFLIVVIVVFVFAIVGLWRVSQVLPRGMLLLIAIIGVFVAGALPGGDRLLVGIKGVCQLIAFAALIFGIIDAVHKRKPPAQTAAPPPAS
ncbi:MAG: hypothetical protein HYX69_10945 [Planctomycetia bacterium]|nr:hypothetical protein [Planctomycetia bacterium]